VLKHITLTFSDPICGCPEFGFEWGTGEYLTVRCHKCGTSVQVPMKDLKARAVFERPYPGKEAAGNVVQLFPKK
jgi:hypothetical protein